MDFTFGKSLESVFLILEALFLWMTFLLAALSAKEIASRILAVFISFLADLMAISNFVKIDLLIKALRFEALSARFAVLVIGICSDKSENSDKSEMSEKSDKSEFRPIRYI